MPPSNHPSAIHNSVVKTEDTLLAYLLKSLNNQSRKSIKNYLKHGAVAVNGVSTTQFDQALKPGDAVSVGGAKAVSAKNALAKARVEIVYEDASLVVINKPPGLLSMATESCETDTAYFRLNEFLKQRTPSRPERIFIVHRLDQETSGLLLFAKTEAVKRSLQDNWESVGKIYQAVVEGSPEPPKGTVRSHLTESKSLKMFSGEKTRYSKEAITHYRLVQSRGPYALLEITLETGRKNQIRVHMADLGHPIVGDDKYGAKTNPARRLALHALRIVFEHPLTKKRMDFSVPLPPVLASLVGLHAKSVNAAPSTPVKH
ncbi:MAG: RluA family pseudouridine synthase [Pedosphaera sp.]|nr:RluA family pseudouridine synthase [Pedosphaera sp.]